MGKTILLNQATFVVVDIETTGSTPGRHAVTEIGAVKVQGGEVVETFVQLVNPEQPIPIFVQRLTGITPDMVITAPTIPQVLPAFKAFLGDAVFVAHHVPFDFGFLQALIKAHLAEDLDNPQLCTCRLAKKLLPTLRRKNLGSVAQHLEIPVSDRHRALGDAQATAQVLIRFLAMMEEKGVRTLAKLLDYQSRGGKRHGDPKVPFAQARLAEYPTTPGVYRMHNVQGEVLYVGKAKNLRKRLQSYFHNLYRQPHKVRELMHQVYDISVEPTGSELEALLEEAHEIRTRQPYYNRQIKPYKGFPFLKIARNEPYPQLTVSTEIAPDNAWYYGPFQHKTRLPQVIELISKVFQLRTCSDAVFQKHRAQQRPCMAYELGTCSGPCIGAVSPQAYQETVDPIRQFLEDQAPAVLATLVVRRDEYAEQLAFEKAAQVHQRLLSLLKLQTHSQRLLQAVHHHHGVIVLPDRDPAQFLLLYVLGGRLWCRQTLDSQTESPDGVLERVSAMKTLLERPESLQSAIAQAELEDVRILAQWFAAPNRPEAVDFWDLRAPWAYLENQVQRFWGDSVSDRSPLLRPTQGADLNNVCRNAI